MGKKRRGCAGLTYRQRDEYLYASGYRTYDEYLRSGQWDSVRRQILGAGTKCRYCGKPATLVHHTLYTYNNLSGKSLEGLVPICGTCHKRIEMCNGKKVRMGTAQRTEERMRKTADYVPDVLGIRRSGAVLKHMQSWTREQLEKFMRHVYSAMPHLAPEEPAE